MLMVIQMYANFTPIAWANMTIVCYDCNNKKHQGHMFVYKGFLLANMRSYCVKHECFMNWCYANEGSYF